MLNLSSNFVTDVVRHGAHQHRACDETRAGCGLKATCHGHGAADTLPSLAMSYADGMLKVTIIVARTREPAD